MTAMLPVDVEGKNILQNKINVLEERKSLSGSSGLG
jgi:hypothetical protein